MIKISKVTVATGTTPTKIIDADPKRIYLKLTGSPRVGPTDTVAYADAVAGPAELHGEAAALGPLYGILNPTDGSPDEVQVFEVTKDV